MKYIKYIVVAALYLSAPEAFANLIVNGSFESPSLPDRYEYVTGGSNSISGWQTVLSGVERFDPNLYSVGSAQDGTLALDLNVDVAVGGGIQQTFSSTIGQSYTLSFYGGTWLGIGHGDSQNGTGQIQVFIDGLLSKTLAVTNLTYTINWTQVSITFVASSTNTTIAFKNFEASHNTYAIIDNVSVLAVPEPASLSIFSIGLVGLGFNKRKKS